MRSEDILVLGGFALVVIGTVIVLSDYKDTDADDTSKQDVKTEPNASDADRKESTDLMSWYGSDKSDKRTAYSEIGETEAMEEENEPYAITWDEFRDGYESWEKLSATYFVPDRVLAGFGNELEKQSISETVGVDMLEPFEDQTEMVDSVYVANPRKKTVYEITRSDDDYATAYSELEEVRQSMGL